MDSQSFLAVERGKFNYRRLVGDKTPLVPKTGEEIYQSKTVSSLWKLDRQEGDSSAVCARRIRSLRAP